jgi:hypothetical protein
MKSFLVLLLAVFTISAAAQTDKSKRPSPPATAKATLKTGATVTIDYSQPAVKGRTIGKDLEPMEGKVWRTGANEATIFTVDKDVFVEKQKLAAGKYGLFTIKEGSDWTIIFNKTWDQWGAYNYKAADDVLRVKVKGEKASTAAERMTFKVDDDGKVNLVWNTEQVEFKVQQ